MQLDFTSIDNQAISGTGTPQDYIVGMPKATTMVMPDMVLTSVQQAQAYNGGAQPGLIPADFLKPIPSIVNTAPEVMAACNPMSDWVNNNPLLAAGLLLALGMAVHHSTKRRAAQ